MKGVIIFMEAYQDQARSFEERAMNLVAHMTLEEKVTQLDNVSAAIPHLGVPEMYYWGEASHGIIIGPSMDEKIDVTSLPACLAMSQSWNPDLLKRAGGVISDEGRAYHNKKIRQGKTTGNSLYWWAPTINLGRDSRWGRNDECFGEDPILAGRLSTAYIEGFQGDDEKYMKSCCSAKHFCANNSEDNRHTGSSNIEEATLREYYLKVWEIPIKAGIVHSAMSSLNRVNGIPVPANKYLLNDILREEWGMDGFVVSDCGAISMTYAKNVPGMGMMGQLYYKNILETVAGCLSAGTDLACGYEYSSYLLQAYEAGMLTEDVIDQALYRVLLMRFRLGLFDEPEKTPYYSIDDSYICSDTNKQIALDTARESLVLVKNNGILPLDDKKYKNILVVGPNAIYQQLGGYSPDRLSVIGVVENDTPLAGISAVAEELGIEVVYKKGWNIGRSKLEEIMEIQNASRKEDDLKAFIPGMDISYPTCNVPERFPVNDMEEGLSDDELMEAAAVAAEKADLVIVIAGNDASDTGEQTDRQTTSLPYHQDAKINFLYDVNPNLIVVGVTSGPFSGDFISRVPAVLYAVYAGQAQGKAIAEVLFGRINPSGRLTQTWYMNDGDLPHISEYGIRPNDTSTGKGRTYQFFDGNIRYPFGYGLSYTSFEYSNFYIDADCYDANDKMKVCVDITNTGMYYGGEVVQLYIRKEIQEGELDNKPLKQLKDFFKVWLQPGETKTVELNVDIHDVTFWDNFRGCFAVEPGIYTIMIGCNSQSFRFEKQIKITGEWNAKIFNVSLRPEKYIYSVGEISRVGVVVTREDATKFNTEDNKPEFSSSDSSVIIINGNGTLEAIAPGIATIFATVSENGFSRTGAVSLAVK